MVCIRISSDLPCVMSHIDLMTNPFYAAIMYSIESRIHAADQLVTTRGLALTDSQVRSALVRTINTAKGRPPAPVPPSAAEKERLPADLAIRIGAARSDVAVEDPQPDGSVIEKPLPTADWLKALLAVRESCELRGDGRPGSRAYLDFLKDFIGQTRGKA